MTYEYNKQKTENFFSVNAQGFSRTNQKQPKLSTRNRILIDKILPGLSCPPKKIIDYGCGGGQLVKELYQMGYDVIGIEPNPELSSIAKEQLKKIDPRKDIIVEGGIETLERITNKSVDMFIAMGVFQYMHDSDYKKIMIEIKRILKQDGHVVCTFQNSLFDMFTFNKYTVDFYENQLFPLFEPYGLNVEKAATDIRKLIKNPGLPEYKSNRARDNIFVRLSNPLTIKGELLECGFDLIDIYFYSLFPTPPLISEEQKDVVNNIINQIEVEKSQEWYGYFIGNAFLTHFQLNKEI